MAAWNFGALSIGTPNFDIGLSGSKLAASQSVHLPQRRRLVRNRSLNVTKWSERGLIGCKCLSKAESFSKVFNLLNEKIIQAYDPAICFVNDTAAVTKVDDGSKETKSSTMIQPDLNSFEVESLLSRICDTTSVAEFELKLGGFRLYVKRNLAGKSESLAQAAPATASVNTTVEAPDPNGSATSPSLALSKPVTSSGGIQSYLNTVADEGLMILQSPKVGYFRRSRTIKGKRMPPPCKEKQTVKEGQVLCYIEQLGGEVPIESDVSGEVIKILREDGEPVGYGDALIAVLPSFPGIKKL